MAAKAPQTELDAVNLMLSAIGEAPIESLDEAFGESQFAQDTLGMAQLEINSWGWSYNSERITLQPNGSGYITLPDTLLSVDPTDSSIKATQRGQYLYNVDKNTFVWCAPVECDLVLSLDFDCLPNHARFYISTYAAFLFTKRYLGAETVRAYTAEDLEMAKRLFKRIEGRHGDYNILTGNSTSNNILNRRANGPRRNYR